jgi:hypothetical protein
MTIASPPRRRPRPNTPPNQGSRIRLVTDAVVAGYIRDISERDRRGTSRSASPS